MLHDISPAIHPGLPVWPGDVPFTRTVTASMQAGAGTTSSAIQATLHLGAHADAPCHYGIDAPGIDKCGLDDYLGPCQLVRVGVGRGEVITPAMCPDPLLAPRVLFATGTFADSAVFNRDFSALSVELIDHLAERGVVLAGIDTPSVDLFGDAALPVHRRVLRHGIAILESLALDGVPAGVYELIALPLRLVDCDASPVRAVLRDLN